MCLNTHFDIQNVLKLPKNLDGYTNKNFCQWSGYLHLDYRNGLLYDVVSNLLKKLEVAKNSATQLFDLLRNCKKHDSVSEYRKQLLWLPVTARIQFKLMTTTWKAIND